MNEDIKSFYAAIILSLILIFATNYFFFKSPPKALSSFSEISFPENINIPKKNTKLALACQAYVAGAVTKKVKKITNNCKFCFEILNSENSRHSQIISSRQYDNCSLQTPSIISTNVCSIFPNEFNSHIDFFLPTLI